MANTPKIRFKGFTDAWEQRKLYEVADFNPKSELPEVFEYVDLESVVGTEMISHRTETKDTAPSRAQRLAQKGDVFFQTVRPYQRNNYLFEKPDNNYVFSTGYAQMRPKIDAKFLMSFLQTDSFVKVVLDNCTGTSYPAINSNDLSNLEISLPVLMDEQRRIGSFITNLDNLITLHQRKCDETKKLKKYMLQKMFPKNGEQFPEIRFEGFTDAWEQRKFSDFTWNAGKRNSQNLDLEPYAVTNDRGFIRQNEAHDEFGYMKDVDRKTYNIVMPNSFAYNPARINVGSIGYYEGTENVIVSSLYEVFQTADYVDDRFLWHWFKSDIFPKWIERLQEGSVRLYFYYDKLCECKMLMPSLPEQRKIAATLDEIDNLITLHQRKCDELKEVKKYMLQNMFPYKKDIPCLP